MTQSAHLYSNHPADFFNVTVESFGQTAKGLPVQRFTLSNRSGMIVKIIDFGGTITEMWTPDREGNYADIVHGFTQLEPYETISPYFGCIVGRFGNRIGKGTFTLEGKTYQLAQNSESDEGPVHLHGGTVGFDKVLWAATPSVEKDAAVLTLKYLSPDGEENFPGNLETTVTYRLFDDNSLRIDYYAVTDAPTPVNLTNHTYFNLNGETADTILDHEMTLFADTFTPISRGLIPTGELRPVKNTPFDFTSAHPIGERIDQAEEQLQFAGGYDHNWVLRKGGKTFTQAASTYAPQSGRVLETWTSEPGVQFYTGNFLDGSIKGKTGKAYAKRSAFCLETQHFPDAPNRPEFPTTIVRPGIPYISSTIYRLSTR